MISNDFQLIPRGRFRLGCRGSFAPLWLQPPFTLSRFEADDDATFSFDKTLQDVGLMQGLINKRARTRLRIRRSLHPQKPTPLALVRSAALGCKSVGGVELSSGRSKTHPISTPC